MATPTIQVFTDNFNRPTINGGTGGYYGVQNSTFAVSNGWLDYVGGNWNITNSNAATCIGLNNFQYLLQDPAWTPGPNSRIVTNLAPMIAVPQTWFLVSRFAPNTDAYAAVLTSSTMTIARFYNNGSFVTLATNNITVTTGHIYQLDLTTTGDGSSTTSMTFVVNDITAGTSLGTITATDSTLELQSGGRTGLGVYNSLNGTALQFTSVTLYSDTSVSFTTIGLGFIGDSLTLGLTTTKGPTSEIVGRLMNVNNAGLRYNAVNVGCGGSITANWLPTSGLNLIQNAITTFTAQNVKIVSIALGSNDAIGSVTPAVWLANMQTIINYVKTQMPSVTVIVNFPPYFDWVRFQYAYGGSSSISSLPLLGSYMPFLSSLTGCTVGDTSAFTSFKNLDFFGLTDGGHPNDFGAPLLANLWAVQIQKALTVLSYLPSTTPVSLNNMTQVAPSAALKFHEQIIALQAAGYSTGQDGPGIPVDYAAQSRANLLPRIT